MEAKRLFLVLHIEKRDIVHIRTVQLCIFKCSSDYLGNMFNNVYNVCLFDETTAELIVLIIFAGPAGGVSPICTE